MRTLFSVLVLSILGTSPLLAQGKQTLGIGDKAPALKVTKWMQGDELKEFAPDKVYVLEFWATWCGPCIRAMPHLTDLANEYKTQGLVVVGVTSKDDSGNDEKSVAEFVEKNGKKFTYGFAYCEDRATDKAYMEAANQDGIPCSFVIDKKGKIAYIGHPMDLDDVLPKVLDGTWRGQEDIDEIGIANKKFEEILTEADKDPAKALTALTDFAKTYPLKAKKTDFMIQQAVLMAKAKKFDDLKVAAETMMKISADKKKAEPAVYVGLILADTELNPDKKHLDVGVKAMDLALSYEKEDVGLLLAAIDLYVVAGEKAKAEDCAQKAIAAAPNEAAKKQIEKIANEKLGNK